jgi:hypothetical protein
MLVTFDQMIMVPHLSVLLSMNLPSSKEGRVTCLSIRLDVIRLRLLYTSINFIRQVLSEPTDVAQFVDLLSTPLCL